MAFGINDEEVSTSFGANDKVVGGFGTSDVAVSKPTSQQTAKPEVDLTKPAFVSPRQRATELKKAQAVAISGRDEKNEGLTWDDLTTNPSLQDIQKQFLEIRTGKKPEGISGVELSNQFMSSARADEWNTFSNIAYLNQLRNSPMPDKEKLALGKLVFERTKSALEEGGQPGARPYVDAVTSAFTDLSNYVGLGVGAGLKKVAATSATKAATRAALGEVAEKGVKACSSHDRYTSEGWSWCCGHRSYCWWCSSC